MISTAELRDGDCFFYLSQGEEIKQLTKLDRYDELARKDGKKFWIDPFERTKHMQLYAEPHIVETTVKQTGEAVSIRVSDGKRFVWYKSNPVSVTLAKNRESFNERLLQLKEERKKAEQEQQKLQGKKRHKKKNAPEEVVNQ